MQTRLRPGAPAGAPFCERATRRLPPRDEPVHCARPAPAHRRRDARTVMQILTQLIFSGIALGMIYAVIAFGYQLTFATSDTLNFGQGAALMLGALVGLTLVNLRVNYWLMFPIG